MVKITVYRWAGSFGPFKVNIPCGECSLTLDVIQDTLTTELDGIEVEVELRDWLSEWWKPLFGHGGPKLAWHAPIVFVNDTMVSQGEALNRGVLTQAVTTAYVSDSEIKCNYVFGKPGCPHCTRVKSMLDDAEIPYTYLDVVKSPRAMYEMLARVKQLIGAKTPVTLPQVWLDGNYLGGADQTADFLGRVSQISLSNKDEINGNSLKVIY